MPLPWLDAEAALPAPSRRCRTSSISQRSRRSRPSIIAPNAAGGAVPRRVESKDGAPPWLAPRRREVPARSPMARPRRARVRSSPCDADVRPPACPCLRPRGGRPVHRAFLRQGRARRSRVRRGGPVPRGRMGIRGPDPGGPTPGTDRLRRLGLRLPAHGLVVAGQRVGRGDGERWGDRRPARRGPTVRGHVGRDRRGLWPGGSCWTRTREAASTPDPWRALADRPRDSRRSSYAVTLVGAVGLEPTVTGIKIRCLTNLTTPQRRSGPNPPTEPAPPPALGSYAPTACRPPRRRRTARFSPSIDSGNIGIAAPMARTVG